jgi:general stress protein 26
MMDEKEAPKLEASLILDTVRETITAAAFCFMISIGENGLPNARLMQPYPPEADLTIWLGASSISRKVQELRKDPRTVLAYQYLEENAYVTMYGRVVLSTDLELRQRYWRESWIDFFPGGPESDDYMLIQFKPGRIEAMNFTRHIHPPPYGLAAAVLELDSGTGTWTIAEE